MASIRKFWRNMIRVAKIYEKWGLMELRYTLDKETINMNEANLYDIELVRNKLQELCRCMKEGSLRDIIFCMRVDLIRNLGNVCNLTLHNKAFPFLQRQLFLTIVFFF